MLESEICMYIAKNFKPYTKGRAKTKQCIHVWIRTDWKQMVWQNIFFPFILFACMETKKKKTLLFFNHNFWYLLLLLVYVKPWKGLYPFFYILLNKIIRYSIFVFINLHYLGFFFHLKDIIKVIDFLKLNMFGCYFGYCVDVIIIDV